MKRREFFHGLPCLEHLPHRGFRIGNIMIGIAVTAVGLSSISRPDLTGRERLFLGMFTVAFLGLLWAQWGVASMSCIAARPVLGAVVGFVSALMALSMFVCLILLGLFFPQAAALLSVTMLLQVLYLTTRE